MRLIDADALGLDINRKAHENFPANRNLTLYAESLLAHAPTVDAVAVIRCKQCRFWDEDKKGFSDECLCRRWSTAGVAEYFTEPESFCSYADLKE